MRRPPRSTLFPYTTLFRLHELRRHRVFCPAAAFRDRSRRRRRGDRKSTRLNSSHVANSYAVFCLKKKILEAGGFGGGGINFDAKIRRNSTDPEDLFHAHIGGMDAFALALIIADNILSGSDYKKVRKNRYASFDKAQGKEFEEGKLSLEDLRTYAIANGEPLT